MTLQIVRKEIEVPLPVDAAFDLFTSGIGQWWPVETHSISAGRKEVPTDLRLEPALNGKIIETLADGSTAVWGHLTRWDPPNGLSIAWYVGRDESQATHVHVDFEGIAGRARLVLVHDGFEALGAEGPKQAENYNSGWTPVLARFSAAVAQTPRKRAETAASNVGI